MYHHNVERLNPYEFQRSGGFTTTQMSFGDGDFQMNSIMYDRQTEFERSINTGLRITNQLEYAIPRFAGFLQGLANFFGVGNDDQEQGPPPPNGYYPEPPSGRYYDERQNGGQGYAAPPIFQGGQGYSRPSFSMFPEIDDLFAREFSSGRNSSGNASGRPDGLREQEGKDNNGNPIKTYVDPQGNLIRKITYQKLDNFFAAPVEKTEYNVDYANGTLSKTYKQSALTGTMYKKDEKVETIDGKVFKTYQQDGNTIKEHLEGGKIIQEITDKDKKVTTKESTEKLKSKDDPALWVPADSSSQPATGNGAVGGTQNGGQGGGQVNNNGGVSGTGGRGDDKGVNKDGGQAPSTIASMINKLPDDLPQTIQKFSLYNNDGSAHDHQEKPGWHRMEEANQRRQEIRDLLQQLTNITDEKTKNETIAKIERKAVILQGIYDVHDNPQSVQPKSKSSAVPAQSLNDLEKDPKKFWDKYYAMYLNTDTPNKKPPVQTPKDDAEALKAQYYMVCHALSNMYRQGGSRVPDQVTRIQFRMWHDVDKNASNGLLAEKQRLENLFKQNTGKNINE